MAPKSQSNSGPALGLALSGGGVRAAVFHLGVLQCLASRRALEAVTRLSTVSGGSLVMAAVMAQAGGRWPSSADYQERIFPSLRTLLTTRDLFSFKALSWSGVLRHAGHLFNRRATILVDLLDRQWGITGKLADLPETPIWWINTTCIETGKNWRFSKREMGDWKFGRHYTPPFTIAEAVAASAAVPYAIGALEFIVPTEGWYDTNPASRAPTNAKTPPASAVHLWDGGAYENLGIEPLYKESQGLIDCEFLICSDASGRLPPVEQRGVLANLLAGRLSSPRLFDISSDQIRSLRSRMVLGSIARGDLNGVVVRMGNSARSFDIKSATDRKPTGYDEFLSDADVERAATHPTDLNALSLEAFDRLARHGQEITELTLTKYATSFSDVPPVRG